MNRVDFTEQELEWLTYYLEDQLADQAWSKFSKKIMEKIIRKLQSANE